MLTHKNKRKFLTLLVLCLASSSCALLAIYYYRLQIRPSSMGRTGNIAQGSLKISHNAQTESVLTTHAQIKSVSVTHAANESVSVTHSVNESVSVTHAANESVAITHSVNKSVAVTHSLNETVDITHSINKSVDITYAANESVAISHAANESTVPVVHSINESVAIHLSHAANESSVAVAHSINKITHSVNESVSISHAANESVVPLNISRAPLNMTDYLKPEKLRENYLTSAQKACLKKKQKQREKGQQLNASDPTVIALRSPTFSNKTFPHLLIGNFINAGKDILTN